MRSGGTRSNTPWLIQEFPPRVWPRITLTAGPGDLVAGEKRKPPVSGTGRPGGFVLGKTKSSKGSLTGSNRSESRLVPLAAFSFAPLALGLQRRKSCDDSRNFSTPSRAQSFQLSEQIGWECPPGDLVHHGEAPQLLHKAADSQRHHSPHQRHPNATAEHSRWTHGSPCIASRSSFRATVPYNPHGIIFGHYQDAVVQKKMLPTG